MNITMNLKMVALSVLFGLSSLCYAQDDDEVRMGTKKQVADDIPVAPAEYRRPEGYNPVEHRFKYNLTDLKEKYSEDLMKKSQKEFNRVVNVNGTGKWKPSGASLDSHQCPEWYQDIKFGMFVDWGPWAIGGWAVKRGVGQPMYPDWYEHRLDHDANCEQYHDKNWGTDFERDDLLPFFQGKRYEPEKLIDIAVESGMKYVIPFSKHCTGYCLWPSSYTFRDAGDMAGQDFIRPLVDNARAKGLKFGFYLCLMEWEYPIIDHDGTLIHQYFPDKYAPYTSKLETWCMGKIPVRDYLRDYLIPLSVEHIDQYDPDILWFDSEWEASFNVQASYDLAAYFYNHAEGRKEVAVNDRYGDEYGKPLRGFRGDFYTSEYGLFMPEDRKEGYIWEENRGISQSFGFNWQDTEENVITSKEFVHTFVDVISRGGNFLMLVNLDGQGALSEVQERRLKEMGKWLKVNGEGIYATRAYSTSKENNIRFTRSKDNKTVYAISLDWPGKELSLKSVQPAAGSKIYMLGYNEPLKWIFKDGVTTITLPAKLQKETNRPCEHAYTFKIQK
jgi:alpha-L-fucosidase